MLQFDESWAYVLPSYMLLRIAEQLPLSESSLEGVARPLPPLLAHHAKEVVLLVQQTVEEFAAPTGVRAGDQVPLRSSSAQLGATGEPGSLSSAELYRLAAGGGGDSGAAAAGREPFLPKTGRRESRASAVSSSSRGSKSGSKRDKKDKKAKKDKKESSDSGGQPKSPATAAEAGPAPPETLGRQESEFTDAFGRVLLR
eukprot:SAG22_NODE_2422_length_2591_cov_1.741172_1_plen_199_part_00